MNSNESSSDYAMRYFDNSYGDKNGNVGSKWRRFH